MSDRPLSAIGLCRRFGEVEVLRNLELEVDHEEFVAVVGPSGCGKSTLLALLSGFEKPTSGQVVRRGRVRTVFQRDGLFPWLTCAENIELGMRENPNVNERRRERDRLLAMIHLNGFSDHYPYQLSGGMRQLVELARAVAGNTDILLMDEPFSALDYLTRLRMRRELIRLLEQYPRAVVFVTHDIEEAAQLADRIVLLSERPGRIRREVRLDAPHPRGPAHPLVVRTVQRILGEMGLESPARKSPSADPLPTCDRKE